jgi:hypothetical protein
MNWIKKIFNTHSNTLTVKSNIIESELVPEPTRSLLFLTDEDPSKASSPMSIKINIVLSSNGVNMETDTGHNFFGEPSLIWKRLTVQKNTSLEEQPLYYPSYILLSPEQRYQYLSWLRDITKPTNLSYVFLYYYGLERHLLIGDFENAFKEIIRLLENHDKGSFRSYAQRALIASVLHRKRLDLFNEYQFLFEGVSNEIFILRRNLGANITPKEIMGISRMVGFTNQNYIRKYPGEFLQELERLVVAYEHENGSLLAVIPQEELEVTETSFFANVSIPDNIRMIKTPQLLTNEKFKTLLCSFLEKTHDSVKQKYIRRNKSER